MLRLLKGWLLKQGKGQRGWARLHSNPQEELPESAVKHIAHTYSHLVLSQLLGLHGGCSVVGLDEGGRRGEVAAEAGGGALTSIHPLWSAR
jgi:hypothetical protein